MVAPRGRRRLRVLAVIVAAGCLVAGSAWRYGPWRERYAVAMPPAGASPRQVVRAYLRALDGHGVLAGPDGERPRAADRRGAVLPG